MYNIPILFEDKDLLVIDKPAGIVVNRADSVKEPTVQDWVEKKFRIQNLEYRIENEAFINRSGIVHRLDKETSGCLIIAKNEEIFTNLQAQFKAHRVKKTYIALVHGQIPSKEGEINVPVDRLPWNKEKFGVVPGGKESVTKYKCITHHVSNVTKDKYTLVELYPESGRTHQIRVHLKYLGFPIVGDYLYAGRKQQKADRKWCPRVFLHAAKIEFFHPKTKQQLIIEAPIPEELKNVLNSLII